MRILIAEDDFTSRNVLAGVLKKEGHQVTAVTNGAEAWQALQAIDAPALVILDWLMPEMEGLDVVRLVRARQTARPPYIIMLTTKDGKADIIAALDAGANDYLTKPCDPGELRARVEVGRRMVEMQDTLAAQVAKLSESEENYRHLIQHLHVGVVVHGPDTSVLLANQEASRVLGLSQEQMKGKLAIDPAWNLIREDGSRLPLSEYPVTRVLAAHRPVIDFIIGVDRLSTADRIWLLVNAFPKFDDHRHLLQIVVTFVDITDRKRSEDALREADARLRLFVNASNIGLWDWSLADDEVYFSREWKGQLGYSEDEIPNLAEEWQQRIHPDDRAHVQAQLRHFLEGSAENYKNDYRMRHKDGSYRWIVAQGQCFRNEEGKALRVMGCHMDITERKQAEQSLLTSEVRLRTLVHTIPDLVWLKDKDGVYLSCNPLFERFFGAREADIVGKTDHDFVDRELADLFRENDCRAMVAGKPTSNEEWITFADDGHRALLETVKTPMYDDSGILIGVLGIGRDITGHKHAADALRQSNSMLQKIFEAIPDQLQLLDRDLRILTSNWKGYYASVPEEMRMHGPHCYQAFYGLERPCIPCHTLEILKTGKPVITKKYSPEAGHIEIRAYPLLDDSGEVSMVLEHIRDINEQWLAEKALRESEQRYRLLIETANEGILVAQGPCLKFVNPMMPDLTGYTEQELLLLPFSDFIHPDDRELVRNNYVKRLEGEECSTRYNFRIFRKDKSIRWFDFTGVRIEWEGHPATLAFLTDITERKQAEDALRQSEERVRTTLNAILLPDGDIGVLELADIIDVQAIQGLMEDFFALENFVTAIVDIHGKILVATGWQDICTQFHRVHPETSRNCLKSDTLLSSGVEPGTFKLYKCKNNLWDLATPIIIGGRHLGNLFSGQFLLEDEMPDYGVFRDQARRYGFDEEEYLAALERVPRWNRERVNQVMAFFARFAQLISGLSYANIKLARALTEREKMEAQLIQAQKMESVGRLAGGVAHDFNNMLSVILGHAELALMMLEPAEPIVRHLLEIHGAAERSADLTRQLLAFARKQTIAPKVLDLNGSVEGMLRMLQRMIGEDLDLAWLPGTGVWPVKMDPSQLDQIMANLCVNARDAISGEGKITLETANANFDEGYCSSHRGFIPGKFVLLAVSDDGCGMDEETLENIFDPFFTTKEMGKGTGLGLATVYGIVKQNNGFINVYSEPGHGTTFRIYLPRHADEDMELKEVAREPVAGGHETILLVEDQPEILAMARAMLEGFGYSVLATSTPDTALRLAGEHAGKISLLLTDVVMPKMNGRELAQRLQALYPGLICMFMSGYTSDVIAHRGVLDEGVHFIQKPFSMQSLAAKVREALDKDAGM